MISNWVGVAYLHHKIHTVVKIMLILDILVLKFQPISLFLVILWPKSGWPDFDKDTQGHGFLFMS